MLLLNMCRFFREHVSTKFPILLLSAVGIVKGVLNVGLDSGREANNCDDEQ
jgi:hypothetical protein